MWTANSEAIDDRSDVRKTFMRWVYLRNTSRDVKLMIRRTLVGEIAVIDFHSYVTVGPPLLPRTTLKRLH